MFEVRIEADSINPGISRLTTFVLTYPRFIHAQVMTHRVFSRNAQSSRSYPTSKMITRLREYPVQPLEWGQNAPGMVATQMISAEAQSAAESVWERARENAIASAQEMLELGVHKQVVNRLLEPFSTITVLLSSTEWDNFFNLRCHEDAQPEMQKLACMIRDAYIEGEGKIRPGGVSIGGWHLPFIRPDDLDLGLCEREICMVSAARCARVSYLNHEGGRDIEKDLDLARRLFKDGHLSPFEHVARRETSGEYRLSLIYPEEMMTTNFSGWVQLRKILEKNP